MRLYLLILLIALPCIVLYLIHGRAYMWAYRATRWRDLDALPAQGHDGLAGGPAPLATRRKASRSERRALGMPMRSAILTVLVILSAFASMALLAPASQDASLAIFGVLACVELAAFFALFVWLDRVPAAGEVRGMQGVLALPDTQQAYVPEGGMLVGGVPVLYPLHWLPLIERDVGQPVDIELTEQGAVLRHGTHLRLDEETQRFDYRPWQPAGVIAGALVVLAVAGLFIYAPIGQRLDTARDALDGHRLLSIDDAAQWQAWRPTVGDEITVNGLAGDCKWQQAGSGVTGGAAAVTDCREVALDLPGQQPALPALQGRVQTAMGLSHALEEMLQTRRNATPEEVREHWRVAGQGSSQRWTLVDFSKVTDAVQALCGAGACAARDMLTQAADAPPARIAKPAPDTLVMDATTVQRVADAGFTLAATVIDPVIESAIAAAQARHAAGGRRVVSQDGGTLARAVATPLPQARDQALLEAVGERSPRLRWLRVAQAVEASGTHPVQFSGAVREVRQEGATQVVTVDTRVQPLAAWVKVAPVLAWLLLAVLAVLASVMALAQRRRQHAQLAAIRQHYATHPPQ